VDQRTNLARLEEKPAGQYSKSKKKNGGIREREEEARLFLLLCTKNGPKGIGKTHHANATPVPIMSG